MPKGNPNPVTKWKAGSPSPNPAGFNREMRKLKLEREAKRNVYLDIMRQEVSQKEYREICKTAVAQAKRGDRYAREWLSKYLAPEQPKQIDRSIIPTSLTAIMESVFSEKKEEPVEVDFKELDVESAGRDTQDNPG